MLTEEAQVFAELGRAFRSADFARLVRAYEREFKRDGQGRFAKVNVNSAIKQQAKKIKAENIPAYDYTPSETVKKMMANKRTKLEKLNDVVRDELVPQYHRNAIAEIEANRDVDTPKRGSKDYKDLLGEVAGEMAGNSYGKEGQKIYNATNSDGWLHLPNKTSIRVTDESFVNEYEVEDEDGEIKERGFFFTKKELDGIVKRHR